MSEEFMVSIEKLVYGGDGLAHEGERTVFVPFVLPGEEVRVSLKSQKKKLAWANPAEIVKPAESRISRVARISRSVAGASISISMQTSRYASRKKFSGNAFATRRSALGR